MPNEGMCDFVSYPDRHEPGKDSITVLHDEVKKFCIAYAEMGWARGPWKKAGWTKPAAMAEMMAYASGQGAAGGFLVQNSDWEVCQACYSIWEDYKAKFPPGDVS